MAGTAPPGEGPQTRETVFSPGKRASKPVRLLLFRNISKIRLQSVFEAPSLPSPPSPLLVPSLAGIVQLFLEGLSARVLSVLHTVVSRVAPSHHPPLTTFQWFPLRSESLQLLEQVCVLGSLPPALLCCPWLSLPRALWLCHFQHMRGVRAIEPLLSPLLGTFFPRVAHALANDMSLLRFHLLSKGVPGHRI